MNCHLTAGAPGAGTDEYAMQHWAGAWLLFPLARAIVSSALLGSLGQQVGSQLLSTLGSKIDSSLCSIQLRQSQ